MDKRIKTLQKLASLQSNEQEAFIKEALAGAGILKSVWAKTLGKPMRSAVERIKSTKAVSGAVEKIKSTKVWKDRQAAKEFAWKDLGSVAKQEHVSDAAGELMYDAAGKPIMRDVSKGEILRDRPGGIGVIRKGWLNIKNPLGKWQRPLGASKKVEALNKIDPKTNKPYGEIFKPTESYPASHNTALDIVHNKIPNLGYGLLGTAAVGGAGYGGYKGYKALKAKNPPYSPMYTPTTGPLVSKYSNNF